MSFDIKEHLVKSSILVFELILFNIYFTSFIKSNAIKPQLTSI